MIKINTKNFFNSNTETEYEEDVLTLTEETKKIILYNDEVNSFEFVIETLIDVCEHEPEQATQCTYIVHYKGKCDVKNGEYDKLKPICSELLRRGLSAEIE
jgi:ATP-dependent Clp protease adaptor protein ClpS